MMLQEDGARHTTEATCQLMGSNMQAAFNISMQ
jgi:hypothetical protein